MRSRLGMHEVVDDVISLRENSTWNCQGPKHATSELIKYVVFACFRRPLSVVFQVWEDYLLIYSLIVTYDFVT